MRIQKGYFVADILHDPKPPSVYHCIIQRKGSADILYWCQEGSEQEALHTAEFELSRLVRSEKTGA